MTVLLAASAQNKCTALVCSCYVPSSRNYSNKGAKENNRSDNTKKQIHEEENRDGVIEELPNNNDQSQRQDKSNGDGSSSSGSTGPHIEPLALKSNLKRNTTVRENQSRTEKRKVTWPDAHGKDIAHIHEFEPSMSEDAELEGVRNSCICTIQ